MSMQKGRNPFLRNIESTSYFKRCCPNVRVIVTRNAIKMASCIYQFNVWQHVMVIPSFDKNLKAF
jgi:hypothetical protein